MYRAFELLLLQTARAIDRCSELQVSDSTIHTRYSAQCELGPVFVEGCAELALRIVHDLLCSHAPNQNQVGRRCLEPMARMSVASSGSVIGSGASGSPPFSCSAHQYKKSEFATNSGEGAISNRINKACLASPLLLAASEPRLHFVPRSLLFLCHLANFLQVTKSPKTRESTFWRLQHSPC